METNRQKKLGINFLREPGSAITHFIGAVVSTIAAIPLIIKAVHTLDPIYIISVSIYALSLILLYTASTMYHSFRLKADGIRRLKKFDHMMISVLIAGSYTPICLLVLHNKLGITLLSIVWGIAILGILIKAFWVHCPKWFSSVLYIGMGWTCIFAITQLIENMSTTAFLWLLIGGILYTMGGVLYAIKLPIFKNMHKHFGNHEVFHLFVMGGSFCHFVLIYSFVL